MDIFRVLPRLRLTRGYRLSQLRQRVSPSVGFRQTSPRIARGQFAEFGEAPAQGRADPASEQAIFTADQACSHASGLRVAYDDAVERMTTRMLDEQGASIVLINSIGAEAEAQARQILDLTTDTRTSRPTGPRQPSRAATFDARG